MAGKVFTGGARLETFLEKIARTVTQSSAVHVGFLASATYPDGTPVAAVAAFSDFGVPSHGQPPRPFFRGMIREKSPTWGKALGIALKQHDYNARTALEQMGEGISGQLREAINEYAGPGLAASTKKAKGFDKELIDTAHMLNSIDFEVK